MDRKRILVLSGAFALTVLLGVAAGALFGGKPSDGAGTTAGQQAAVGSGGTVAAEVIRPFYVGPELSDEETELMTDLVRGSARDAGDSTGDEENDAAVEAGAAEGGSAEGGSAEGGSVESGAAEGDAADDAAADGDAADGLADDFVVGRTEVAEPGGEVVSVPSYIDPCDRDDRTIEVPIDDAEADPGAEPEVEEVPRCDGVLGTVTLADGEMVDVADPTIQRNDECGADGVGLAFPSIQPIQISGMVRPADDAGTAVGEPIDLEGSTPDEATPVSLPSSTFPWLPAEGDTVNGYLTCVEVGAVPDETRLLSVSASAASGDLLPRSITTQLAYTPGNPLFRVRDDLDYAAFVGEPGRPIQLFTDLDGLRIHVGYNDGETPRGSLIERSSDTEPGSRCERSFTRGIPLGRHDFGEEENVARAAVDGYEYLKVLTLQRRPAWNTEFDLCVLVETNFAGRQQVERYEWQVRSPDPNVWEVEALYPENHPERIASHLQIAVDGGLEACEARVPEGRGFDAWPAHVCSDFVIADEEVVVSTSAEFGGIGPDAVGPATAVLELDAEWCGVSTCTVVGAFPIPLPPTRLPPELQAGLPEQGEYRLRLTREVGAGRDEWSVGPRTDVQRVDDTDPDNPAPVLNLHDMAWNPIAPPAWNSNAEVGHGAISLEYQTDAPAQVRLFAQRRMSEVSEPCLGGRVSTESVGVVGDDPLRGVVTVESLCPGGFYDLALEVSSTSLRPDRRYYATSGLADIGDGEITGGLPGYEAGVKVPELEVPVTASFELAGDDEVVWNPLYEVRLDNEELFAQFLDGQDRHYGRDLNRSESVNLLVGEETWVHLTTVTSPFFANRHDAEAHEAVSYQDMIAGLRNDGVEVSAIVPDSTLRQGTLRIERRTRIAVTPAS